MIKTMSNTTTTTAQAKSAVGRPKAPSSVNTSTGEPVVSIKVTDGEKPPPCQSSTTDSATCTVTVSRGASGIVYGVENSGPGKPSARSFLDRFKRFKCAESFVQYFSAKSPTNAGVRDFVIAVESGEINEFAALKVASAMDRLTQDAKDPARRATSISDFTARYAAIHAAVSEQLAWQMLYSLDEAAQQLDGKGAELRIEVPKLGQVFASLGQQSREIYAMLAKLVQSAESSEDSDLARDLLWATALFISRYRQPDGRSLVRGTEGDRVALMTRCVCQQCPVTFFSELKKAFQIESDDLLGISLAQVRSVRAHILKELEVCRAILNRGEFHIVVAARVLDDTNFADFVDSIVTHFVATGELKSWSKVLSEEAHG